MEVKLLTSPYSFHEMERFAALAALTCYANTEYSYVPHEVLAQRIEKKDESVLEHITLTYSVKGLSRACLQELKQHRYISLSAESTRYTLDIHLENKQWVESLADKILPCQRDLLYYLVRLAEISDYNIDELKYYLPEFWPTNLILTSNIRELRHILTIRTSPATLNEFRVLAYSLFEAVPESFKYLLEDCVYRENSDYVRFTELSNVQDAQKGGEA